MINTIRKIDNPLPKNPYVTLLQNCECGLIPPDTLRVVVFERKGGNFFINQHLQLIETGHLYVIPPAHTYRLKVESAGNVMALDIALRDMTDECRQALYSVAFREDKAFDLGEDRQYYRVLKEAYRSGPQHTFQDKLLSPLSKSVKLDTPLSPDSKLAYLKLVDRFYGMLPDVQSLYDCDTPYLSDALHTHKQTLQRAFKNILNSSVKKIITQCLISRAVSMLYQNQAEVISMSEIAYSLGFSSESDFARYFKNSTGMSPTQFKKFALQQIGE